MKTIIKSIGSGTENDISSSAKSTSRRRGREDRENMSMIVDVRRCQKLKELKEKGHQVKKTPPNATKRSVAIGAPGPNYDRIISADNRSMVCKRDSVHKYDPEKTRKLSIRELVNVFTGKSNIELSSLLSHHEQDLCDKTVQRANNIAASNSQVRRRLFSGDTANNNDSQHLNSTGRNLFGNPFSAPTPTPPPLFKVPIGRPKRRRVEFPVDLDVASPTLGCIDDNDDDNNRLLINTQMASLVFDEVPASNPLSPVPVCSEETTEINMNMFEDECSQSALFAPQTSTWDQGSNRPETSSLSFVVNTTPSPEIEHPSFQSQGEPNYHEESPYFNSDFHSTFDSTPTSGFIFIMEEHSLSMLHHRFENAPVNQSQQNLVNSPSRWDRFLDRWTQ